MLIKTIKPFYKIPPKQAIFVANHPSLLDGLLIILFAPCKPLIIANKWAYTKFHLIGKLIGVKIVKNDTGGALQAVKHLKKGGSVLIFPEGNLSKKSNYDYLDGFVRIARLTKVNVYPIQIIKKGLKYTLIFHHPIEWENCWLYQLFGVYCLSK